MRSSRTSLPLFVVAWLAMAGSTLILVAQTPVFIPAPVWPSDGNVPEQFSDRYVFYDPNTEEIVLAIPENIDNPGFATNPGRRHIQRIATNRGSRPALDVAVARLPSGARYRYSYQLSNGAGALKPIMSWNLYTNWIADEGVVDSPLGWLGSMVPTQAALGSVRSDGPYGPFTIDSGMFVNWHYAVDEATILPGTALDEFVVTSDLKPGFSFAYVRAGPFISPPVDLPSLVQDQLVPVLSRTFNTQGVITIGPKFSAGASRIEIAQDFSLGIQRLIGDGRVQDSPSIQEAMLALSRYIERADVFANASMALTVSPANDVEAAILNALRLSMD